MADNSEHKIGGIFPLPVAVRALSIASRALSVQNAVDSNVILCVRALTVDLGLLVSDIELLNWFNTRFTERDGIDAGSREFVWQVGLHLSASQIHDPAFMKNRPHIRDILKQIRRFSPHERGPSIVQYNESDKKT